MTDIRDQGFRPGRKSVTESTGKKEPRPRRSFTPESKAEILERCGRGDRPVGQITKDLDLTETAVRDRVKQAVADTGERDGLTSSEREEPAALRRENRRLRGNRLLRPPHRQARPPAPSVTSS